MSGVRIALTVVFIVICAILVYLIFKSKGSGADLTGGIVNSRATDSYYSMHGRKHSEDAVRERTAAIFTAIFIVLCLVLNMSWGY